MNNSLNEPNNEDNEIQCPNFDFGSNVIEVPIEICSPNESSMESSHLSQDRDNIIFNSDPNSSCSSQFAPAKKRVDRTAAERNRQYRKRNRDKINQRRREYRNGIKDEDKTLDNPSYNAQIWRQRRYYERHREEINKRKREQRKKDNPLKKIPSTAAERMRSYRERNRQKINERKRLSRALKKSEQQDTDSNIDNIDSMEEITDQPLQQPLRPNFNTLRNLRKMVQNLTTTFNKQLMSKQDEPAAVFVAGLPEECLEIEIGARDSAMSDIATVKLEPLCELDCPEDNGKIEHFNQDGPQNVISNRVFIKQEPIDDLENQEVLNSVEPVTSMSTTVYIKKEPVDDHEMDQSGAAVIENSEVNNESQIKTKIDTQKTLVTDTKVTSQVSKKGDVFDDFGAYIASVLRGLPRDRAMAIQPKIIGLINSTEAFKDIKK